MRLTTTDTILSHLQTCLQPTWVNITVRSLLTGSNYLRIGGKQVMRQYTARILLNSPDNPPTITGTKGNWRVFPFPKNYSLSHHPERGDWYVEYMSDLTKQDVTYWIGDKQIPNSEIDSLLMPRKPTENSNMLPGRVKLESIIEMEV